MSQSTSDPSGQDSPAPDAPGAAAPSADKAALRRQDFWTALVLIGLSLFFIAETFEIPFFRANAAGVESGRWYNSAALVPFGVFGALLLLSCGLLYVAIRDGGAPRALADIPLKSWISSRGGASIVAVCVIMLAYIFGLTPRTDFILSSALVLSALIYGFHTRRWTAIAVSTIAVLIPALYALVTHFPPSDWATPHDDDWLTLWFFLGLCAFMLLETRIAEGRINAVVKWTPVVAFVAPFLLVSAMAFGFRQNVPNRTGLLFQQIEYQWFVTIKPALFE